ncbi:hypothetical protein RMSM_03953 [Rhodopirellula maiorica SM1]|uniref:Uncharacterized protein n=1 Tax=Rhodopirellula maiorica SM1 TaxID=1265738 RepID=M5RIJ2_9BACT|nr:hypothetical protein RMSM_03953 [Rhodopirellula maiorica SM1]
MDRSSPLQTKADNHDVHRRSGVAKLGHHNVNRRIAVTSTVIRLDHEPT